MEFSQDTRYQAIAEAYASDAVDYALEHLERTLDWSDESIKELEAILDIFSKRKAQAKWSNEELFAFAKLWGSYLGEVFRKNHGAIWGIIEHEGQSMPGLQSVSGTMFWPWGRAENRIRNGREDNVWHYYLHLMGRH